MSDPRDIRKERPSRGSRKEGSKDPSAYTKSVSCQEPSGQRGIGPQWTKKTYPLFRLCIASLRTSN